MKTEGNMITDWLSQNTNPEIYKQVEKEAKNIVTICYCKLHKVKFIKFTPTGFIGEHKMNNKKQVFYKDKTNKTQIKFIKNGYWVISQNYIITNENDIIIDSQISKTFKN